MKSETLDQLAAALSAAQAEFSAVPKDKANPFFKSTYADLASVVKTATPVLTKNGLSISQFITNTEDGGDALVTYLLHSSGQFIAHTMKLHLPKTDPQGQGSAVTYARRYSFMSVLGLVADVDDDGNAASSQSRPLPARQSEVAPKPTTNGEASPAQVKALTTMLKKKNRDIAVEVVTRWNKELPELTKAEASTWIDEINSQPKPGEAPFV